MQIVDVKLGPCFVGGTLIFGRPFNTQYECHEPPRGRWILATVLDLAEHDLSPRRCVLTLSHRRHRSLTVRLSDTAGKFHGP
jgi:hypothetical protein